MKKMYNFLLLTGQSLAEVMQQLPGALQELTKGKDFDITSMLAVPEMMPGRVIQGQPRLQLSVVFAIKMFDTDGVPGMESDNAFVGGFDVEGLQAVKAAAKSNGIAT